MLSPCSECRAEAPLCILFLFEGGPISVPLCMAWLAAPGQGNLDRHSQGLPGMPQFFRCHLWLAGKTKSNASCSISKSFLSRHCRLPALLYGQAREGLRGTPKASTMRPHQGHLGLQATLSKDEEDAAGCTPRRQGHGGRRLAK